MFCNKENVDDVLTGIKDKKTNGPLLLSLALNCRGTATVGQFPTLQPATAPQLFLKPPTVIRFSRYNETMLTDGVDIGWTLKMQEILGLKWYVSTTHLINCSTYTTPKSYGKRRI